LGINIKDIINKNMKAKAFNLNKVEAEKKKKYHTILWNLI